MELRNTKYRFSVFPSLVEVNPEPQEMDINGLIEVVKYGYLSKKITALRGARSRTVIEKIKKSELPAVTISGVFSKRKNDGLVCYSSLIQLDLDDVPEYDTLFKFICEDIYTYVCFRSPRGKGIKVIVKIGPDAANHKRSFLSLSKYYQDKFHVEVDAACKDVSRAMLLSWDSELYCNPFSHPYYDLIISDEIAEPKVSYSKEKGTGKKRTGDKYDLIEKILAKVESRKSDLTDTYEKWFRIGCALAESFGESGRKYFHRLSQFYPKYSHAETDKLYAAILKRNQHKITLGTLVFIAREKGLDV